MGVKIGYDGKNYYFEHDGRHWDKRELVEHVSEPGHERVIATVGVSSSVPDFMEAYNHCSGLAKEVNEAFDSIFGARTSHAIEKGNLFNTPSV